MPRTPRAAAPPPSPLRRSRGFEPAFGLLQTRIQKAGESRGFAVARLLTRWAEIAGQDVAAVTRPVKVGYTRDGLGATLTLLVAAAHAPLVQMRLPELKARVNSVYGYSAISRITLTQTAPGGFAEGQDPFAPAPGDATRARTVADPVVAARASQVAAPVRDGALRSALEALARNVLSRGSQQKG